MTPYKFDYSYILLTNRYVEIEFRFLPFRHFDKHPGHVRALVEIGSTMAQLGNLVRSLSSIIARNFRFYLSEQDYPMSALPDHSSLEDVGVIGGTKFHPAKQKMFYDYEIEDDFCPILLCDHYFCDMFHVWFDSEWKPVICNSKLLLLITLDSCASNKFHFDTNWKSLAEV